MKTPTYEVIVRDGFFSRHALRHYHGGIERLHSHNFRVEVVVRGKTLENKVKYLVDFSALRDCLQEVVQPLAHINLNKFPAFERENPSAENLARYIAGRLEARWKKKNAEIIRVAVWENNEMGARYWPRGADEF
jgi:6-pyruvoyltetrahydropterin/6-carboxytetrahydropterin synthase